MLEQTKEIISQINEEDISSLLNILNQAQSIKKQVTDLEIEVGIKVKRWLLSRGWDKYNDKETKLSVSIEKKDIKGVDWTQVKYLLKPHMIKQIATSREIEELIVVSSETKEKIKSMLRKNVQKDKSKKDAEKNKGK